MDASSTSTSFPPSPTVQRRAAQAFQRIQRQKSPESPSKSLKSLNSPTSLRPRPSFCLPAIFLIFLFLCIDGIFATNSTVQLEGWRLFDEEFPQNPSKFGENLDENGRRQFALELANNDGHRRQKRQWGYGGPQQQQQQMMCPPQCFQCSPMHCQAYQCIQPQMMNMMRCCCRPAIIMHPQPDLKTACDGEEAVAACLNGLCGQGYFCNARKFCCRCQNGKSLGQCMNGLCPAGYACNSNNFCCAIGAGSVLGPCANGKCPEGYECGAGELCYARTGNSAAGTASSSSNSIRRNYPPIRRPRPRWSPNGGSRLSGGGGGGFGAGKRRRNQRGRNGGGGNGWGRRFGGEGEDWWQQEAAEFIQEAGEDY